MVKNLVDAPNALRTLTTVFHELLSAQPDDLFDRFLICCMAARAARSEIVNYATDVYFEERDSLYLSPLLRECRDVLQGIAQFGSERVVPQLRELSSGLERVSRTQEYLKAIVERQHEMEKLSVADGLSSFLADDVVSRITDSKSHFEIGSSSLSLAILCTCAASRFTYELKELVLKELDREVGPLTHRDAVRTNVVTSQDVHVRNIDRAVSNARRIIALSRDLQLPESESSNATDFLGRLDGICAKVASVKRDLSTIDADDWESSQHAIGVAKESLRGCEVELIGLLIHCYSNCPTKIAKRATCSSPEHAVWLAVVANAVRTFVPGPISLGILKTEMRPSRSSGMLAHVQSGFDDVKHFVAQQFAWMLHTYATELTDSGDGVGVVIENGHLIPNLNSRLVQSLNLVNDKSLGLHALGRELADRLLFGSVDYESFSLLSSDDDVIICQPNRRYYLKQSKKFSESC